MADLPPEHYWLIAGVLMLAVEAVGIPGAGFLFAGLAAIVLGVLVNFNVITEDDLLLQFGAFGGLTALLALLLWNKLKNWRKADGSEGGYSNMVGDLATVGKGGLKQGEIGQASWSGTNMMAELAHNAKVEHLDEGAMARIVAVKGNHLIVAPKD